VVLSKVGGAANKESTEAMLHFNPLQPTDEFQKRRGGLAGRPTEIALTDEHDPEAAAREREALTPRRGRPIGSPKLSTSRVSFSQTDSDPVVTGRKILDAPGGFSELSLASVDQPGSPNRVAPVYRAQDALQVDLHFHPEGAPGAEDDVHRRMRGAGATPNTSTIILAHSSSRVDSELEDTGLHFLKQRKHLAGTPVSVRFDDSQSAALLDAYRAKDDDAAGEVDPAVLRRLSQAVYAHSQRLRHTFQEWNKSSSATLSRENFVAGAKSLQVDLSEQEVDQIFARFDADGDQELSYAEWVKICSQKE